MFVWVAAVVFSGFSQDFWTLLLARSLTGVGEASFLVMAAPLIDFFAPPTKRSTWLAIFYAAIPIGYAAGAAVGGIVASQKVRICTCEHHVKV
jgi:MFS family permease